MFTGIVLAIGTIGRIARQAGDFRLTINTGHLPTDGLRLGDSVAVNGVCLTAVELGTAQFCADVSNETWDNTTLRLAKVGDRVNLELALTPATPLGGHIVTGHVDGVGTVLTRIPDARSVRLGLQAPAHLAKYIAQKGSVCVDGVSLTVNEVSGARFGVNIVPHTLQATTLGGAAAGDEVNLEVDLIARYLERLMRDGPTATTAAPTITEDLLRGSGFLR